MSAAGAGPAAPALSIVVGARSSETSAMACMSALVDQMDDTVELILVEDQPSDLAFPGGGRRVVVPGGLVPELWAEGIRQATGDLVGLLAATVVPDPDWVARTFELHKGGDAAVGGPVEPGPGMGLVDWAVYFCRYAPYMLPILDGAALDVPADNASYRADALRLYAALYERAFAEPFVHRSMRGDGRVLRVDPRRVVRVAGGARAGAFCRQRFRHGRDHGRLRSAGLGRREVLLGAATAPLVPIVMTVRAAGHVVGKRRHLGRFAMVAPLVVWFYSWWAAGELAGRLGAALRGSGS